ncbi:bacterial sec-independent translocation protein mttA/Hcf106 [Wolffia australiana]
MALMAMASPSCSYFSPLRAAGSSFAAGGHGRLALRSSSVSLRRVGRKSSGALGSRCLFGLGVPELVVIAGVAALVFGPKKLPEIGRGIGKTVKSFQQAAKEFETELKKEPDEATDQKPQEVSNKDGKELESSSAKEKA